MARGSKIEHTFPTRGTPGGWLDAWEQDDTVELRARSEEVEHRQNEQAAILRRKMQAEDQGETPRLPPLHSLRSQPLSPAIFIATHRRKTSVHLQKLSQPLPPAISIATGRPTESESKLQK